MYKASTYLVVTYFPTYLPTYIWDLFVTNLVTKVKLNINSVEVIHNWGVIMAIQWMDGHPVDDALVVVAGSSRLVWSLIISVECFATIFDYFNNRLIDYLKCLLDYSDFLFFQFLDVVLLASIPREI